SSIAVVMMFALLVLARVPALAWSGPGHMVIAAEAYRQLSPKLKKKVTEILKAHPDYEKWEKSFTGNNSGLGLDTFIFMRASTWADEIRGHGDQYDHPHWHFVDYLLRPPSFPFEPSPAPEDDVLYGI